MERRKRDGKVVMIYTTFYVILQMLVELWYHSAMVDYSFPSPYKEVV